MKFNEFIESLPDLQEQIQLGTGDGGEDLKEDYLEPSLSGSTECGTAGESSCGAGSSLPAKNLRPGWVFEFEGSKLSNFEALSPSPHAFLALNS